MLILAPNFFQEKAAIQSDTPNEMCEKKETVLIAVERKEALCLGFSSYNTLKEEAKTYFQQARCRKTFQKSIV